jgi:hypothetical protein
MESANHQAGLVEAGLPGCPQAQELTGCLCTDAW